MPIRGVREYRFVYGDNTPGVGQGDGDAEPGQVVGKAQQGGRRRRRARPAISRASTTTRPTSRSTS